MKHVAPLLSILLLTMSCRSLQFSVLERGIPLEQKLPPLEPVFDTHSFAIQYSDLYDIPSAILSRDTDIFDSTLKNASSELKIAEDTKRIFASEFVRNISENIGETTGYVVCRRGLRSKGIKSYVNPILSTFTLGLINLFGYTYAVMRDEIEVVVDFYDLNDKVVASFSGIGYGEAKVKLYSGYMKYDAVRLAHARAFTESMNDIKNQINENRENLIAVLSQK